VEALTLNPELPFADVVADAMFKIPEPKFLEIAAVPRVAAWISNWGAPRGSKLYRMEVLIDLLDNEIYRRRREELLRSNRPYDHVALHDLRPDRSKLVPLSSFDCSRGALERNGFAFMPTPPLRPFNSQFWSSAALFKMQAQSTAVRVDPLFVVPVASYRQHVYSMYVYGRDLDWQRIATLRGEEAAQWLPDDVDGSDIQFTDVIWQRRDDGVHFECEEVPKDANARPARYFHAILDTRSNRFVHTDAALRFYDSAELTDRKNQHLRHLGKVGTRIKLFRVDDALDTITWSTLAAGAFVWNRDLQAYFRGQREFGASNSK
jgi:hypothetical protein